MRPKYYVDEDIDLNTHNISIVEDEFSINFLESEIYNWSFWTVFLTLHINK